METDAPFNYAKVHDKKIPATIRERLSGKAQRIHRYSSFQRNEPSSLLATCELIAAYMTVSPKLVARITTENALKLFKLR